MKRERCDREAVALLACSALSAIEAAATSRHLEHCPACRAYFQQMSAVCTEHADAARCLPVAEISPRLHARVAAAVRADRHGASDPWLAKPSLRWFRLAATTFVGLLIAGSSFMSSRRLQPPALIMSQVTLPPSLKHLHGGPVSKLMTYRLALNRSTEEFDRLLAKDAVRSSSDPATSFRVAGGWLEP